MKRQTIFLLVFFFLCFISFSQTSKFLHGKIISGEMTLAPIDIVNLNSKKLTKPESDGSFTILAKTGDELYFISKVYVEQKIILTQVQFDQNNLIIYLEKKPIELDDVNIIKAENMKIKVSQADMDEAKLIKQQNKLKVQNVHTGEIENGVDFVRIGKGIANLFKSKDGKKPKSSIPSVGFQDYISSNFDSVFFVEELKLKPEEINLFISYCEVDVNSKTISENQNLLETIEFLIGKNEDFKKPIDSDK